MSDVVNLVENLKTEYMKLSSENSALRKEINNLKYVLGAKGVLLPNDHLYLDYERVLEFAKNSNVRLHWWQLVYDLMQGRVKISNGKMKLNEINNYFRYLAKNFPAENNP